MNRSETINKLALALVKFNNEVSSIPKDAKNPFYHSEYVTLDKLIISTRDILQKNGLSVMQFPLSVDGKIGIQTILLHESGEFIESEPLYMTPAKLNDPQAAGSIISYLRRYSYQAILNLNTGEDDDANIATYGNSVPEQSKSTGKLSAKQVGRLLAIGLKAGIKEPEIKKVIKSEFGKDKIEDLSIEAYNSICSRLDAKAK